MRRRSRRGRPAECHNSYFWEADFIEAEELEYEVEGEGYACAEAVDDDECVSYEL
jgi:hypothetical protein